VVDRRLHVRQKDGLLGRVALRNPKQVVGQGDEVAGVWLKREHGFAEEVRIDVAPEPDDGSRRGVAVLKREVERPRERVDGRVGFEFGRRVPPIDEEFGAGTDGRHRRPNEHFGRTGFGNLLRANIEFASPREVYRLCGWHTSHATDSRKFLSATMSGGRTVGGRWNTLAL
jgi:hypothetical protein